MIALQILKVTGIVLLCILLFIILLLLILLLAPIRYRIDGSVHEKDIRAKVRVNWLLHIIRFLYSIEGKEKEMSLKVLWIKLMPKDEKKGQSGGRRRRRKDHRGAPGKADKYSEGSDRLFEEDDFEDSDYDEADRLPEVFGDSAEDHGDAGDIRESDSGENMADKYRGDTSRKTDLLSEETGSDTDGAFEPSGRKRSIFDKIRCKLSSLYDKIMRMKKKISDILFVLNDERDQEAVRELLYRTGKLLRHILPRRSNLRIRLGLGDPASTGQAAGLVYALWPLYRGHVSFEPDFDEKVTEGELDCRGYVQLMVVLIALARVYFNKDIRRLYRHIQKIRTE